MDHEKDDGPGAPFGWSAPTPVTGGYVTLTFATYFNPAHADFVARFSRVLGEWVRELQPAGAAPEAAAIDEGRLSLTFGFGFAASKLATDVSVRFPSEYRLLGQPLAGLPMVRVRLGFGLQAPPSRHWAVLMSCAESLVVDLHDLLPEATVVLGGTSATFTVKDFDQLRQMLGQ